ncbi:MAG: hypothetical protein KZQ66_14745 [Candidatus Thiodiazotropha sp. (ex Lucinoma aequizonata)]|nr:hypothetical protein [Candidatus Thiodiazotropha sp. (ex Lucinoma aequizonata)]MCU7898640.1 hypothetical protein [Candidatus Thiodiazotropha sp. (ex Lucinoma aequizonata)]MCU7903095.1 hypothetical protein [Candidatus Thiodiazotropha sp. (ex Lucinoma aequizonata)]MCU7913733.1 hypothetical protein [Candidatus Thiodiazotropha sp. (ex Lucinoma aequizonata)]
MRSLYALHLSLSVAILAIQPRLRLSGTNRLRSVFHGGQRMKCYPERNYSAHSAMADQIRPHASS